MMRKILIIDDDRILAECVAQMLPGYAVQTCANAFDAINIINAWTPDLLLLDILLDGPDGFSLLNELISYDDTMKIPVIVMSSLDLGEQNLSHYGVVKILHKETMTPEILQSAVQEGLAHAE